MRHISPKEMASMLETIPVSSVVFRRPASGSGVVVEMLARNGEEIMVSEQGTPDPVVFTSPAAMAFFRELGFFSGSHDDVVLDARHYRPAGFGFMQGQLEMPFGEVRKRGEAADVLDFADEEPRELEQSQFTTTIYTLHDTFPGEEYTVEDIARAGLDKREEKDREEAEEPHPRIGEKYLTTLNLIRMTGVTIVLDLLLIFLFPSASASMKQVLYICAGSMLVLAVSFVFFEKNNPEHTSLRIRRYIWLCLIVFNISMALSYLIGGRVISGG